MPVELVHAVTSDGVRLDGVLARPAPEANLNLPVDVMVCHHGVGGNFYSPYVFEAVGQHLLSQGCAVIRANNRGHDVVHNPAAADTTYEAVVASRSKGLRLGAAYELMADSVNDWQAWIDMAAGMGFRRIGLWGHSLGAVKTIHFLAQGGDSRVQCAIASSPPRFNHAMFAESSSGDEFLADLAKAQAFVASGKPEMLLTVDQPTPSLFTAATFVDKYGPHDRYDILPLLPDVQIPLLITLGGAELALAFTDLRARGDAIAAGLPMVDYQLIDGADHLYLGKTVELWSRCQDWLAAIEPTV